MAPQDLAHLCAEITLHLQNQTADLVLVVASAPREQLLNVRIHAPGCLAGADRAENHHARVQAAARDGEPRRPRHALGFGRMMLLAQDEEQVLTGRWIW